MGYSSADDFDLKRNTRYALPPEAVEKLLTSDAVRTALQKGESSVEVSILKWQRLVEVIDIINRRSSPEKYIHNLASYIGYQSCALCIESMGIYKHQYGSIKNKSDKCEVCPLARIDCCIKPDSAYMKIEQIIRTFTASETLPENAAALVKELTESIRKMQINLVSLRRILQKKR